MSDSAAYLRSVTQATMMTVSVYRLRQIADELEQLEKPPACGADVSPHSCPEHRTQCTQIVDSRGNSCPHCVIDAASKQLEQANEAMAAADRLAHQTRFSPFHQDYWAARGGHGKCTVCKI